MLRHITPHGRTLALLSGLILAGNAVSLLGPLLAGRAADELTGADPSLGSIAPLLGLWFIVLLTRAVTSFASSYHLGVVGEEILGKLRALLHEHMQALPLAYHEQVQRGDTLSLLYADASSMSGYATATVVRLLPALTTFFAALLLTAWVSPPFALLAAALLPPYVLLMKLVGRRLRPLSRAWVDANSAVYRAADENLAMLPAIKAFSRESLEHARFARRVADLVAVSRRQQRVDALLAPATSLLGGTGLLIALALAAYLVDSGSLQTGDLVTVLLYSTLMLSPLQTVAQLWGSTQTTRGAAERIVEFLETAAEPDDDSGEDLAETVGSVHFENVSFAYRGRAPALQDFDLSIAAGETVALTGPNGAGKSTVARLLMRFSDPDTGRVMIDGVDLRNCSIRSVRAQIGLVSQRVLLMNGTVEDNIAWSLPGATRAQIHAAARAARVDDVIASLPQGYDTIVGDQGVRLSGGQRQRIALARALLKNPPILILDEATAMFDPDAEQDFIRECHEILERRTVILITHRPASLALADRIVRLEGGRIVGETVSETVAGTAADDPQSTPLRVNSSASR